MIKKNIYVVSDCHGYYDELINSLNKNGYDENDKNSLLIDCGDFFDRGEKSLEIYKYYKRLSDEGKAIILKGNHTTMFINFLEGKDCVLDFLYNGFNKTIDSFLGDTLSWHTFNMYVHELQEEALKIYGERVKTILGDISNIPPEKIFSIYQEYAREKIMNDFPELLSWLKERPYYYETKNYIYTHSSIQGDCEDWKNPTYSRYSDWTPWEYLLWDDGNFYGKEIKNTNKVTVCGHFHTDGIREKFNLEITGTNEILRSEDGKKIFIDTCTPITHRVNVLKITDEEIL